MGDLRGDLVQGCERVCMQGGEGPRLGLCEGAYLDGLPFAIGLLPRVFHPTV